MEAPFTLAASIPAGTWQFILDCIIDGNVTVTFDLLWRRDGSDTIVTEFGSSYTPIAGQPDAVQPASFTETGIAIDFERGDQLVFRYTANADSGHGAYNPNGDGSDGGSGSGRFPNITLPQ